ncbi:site-specific integrase [Paenibacillus caseinilyticus]|uniref:site-specific integrase n=1 Tax=Paenibacillus caseinilyticus TaxID=3098138 RepID=UPI0022B8F0EA|nr:site-specific integrase [Paenibacillus caseinilyticus]MCZ8518857.1 site-specific integrase [Paenibacillus caseinilyticus]
MKGYFRKRGEKWSFSVDLGPDPATGKRRQKTVSGFKTKKEAERACAELIAAIEGGTYSNNPKQNLETYLTEWLQSKAITLKKNTFASYTNIVTHHLIPAFGKIELTKLTPAHISKFHAELLNDKGLKEGTVRDIHKVLTTALNQAVKWGMLQKNVASLVEKPRPRAKELSVWNEEEAKRFIKTAVKSRSYIAFLLAISTGMRQGEILGLRWKDVDLVGKTIYVSQTLSHDGKELTAGAKTKSGSRKISIDDTLANELKKQKSRVSREKMQTEPGKYTDLDLVVPTSKGTPVTPRNLSRSFYALMEDAKVPTITFHDMRHTHATLLLSQGIHPKVVAERLGHADMRTTLEIYSHVLPDIQKDAATKFGAMFYAD